MKVPGVIALLAASMIAVAGPAAEPECFFDVIVKNDGVVVERATGQARLGATARVTLKDGKSVDATAGVRGPDGRSKVMARINIFENGDTRFTHEMVTIANLAQSKPSFEYTLSGTKTQIVAVFRSPALLAQVR